MVAPINSLKHYVHLTNTLIASGVLLTNAIVHAVIAPATTNPQDVKQGAVVKAVYFERWLLGDSATGNTATFTVIVEKVPGNGTPMTFAQSLNLGGYPNKKNILYTTQGIVSDTADGSNPVPVIRGWIKIPKGKQRMGLDDIINIHVSAVGALRACGIATYKEYL